MPTYVPVMTATCPSKRGMSSSVILSDDMMKDSREHGSVWGSLSVGEQERAGIICHGQCDLHLSLGYWFWDLSLYFHKGSRPK